MKICITSSDDTLDSIIDNRFARCRYFIFADTETGQNEAIRNPASILTHGSGLLAAKTIVEHRPGAVITDNIGPNALKAILEAKIKICQGHDAAVMDLIVAFSKGELKEIDTATVRDHFGTNESGKHSTGK